MSAILGTSQFNCYFNQGPHGPPFDDEPCSGPGSTVIGGVTAAMPGGSWLGALISGFITDRLGRKTAIQIGACIWLVGSTIVCASQNLGMCSASVGFCHT